MTIFDLPKLDPAIAAELVQATLAKFPILSTFYDAAFIGQLIRRRQAADNFLLLRLVQPDDELNIAFWTDVTEDLATLEPEGALASFKAKFRKHDREALDSARTELFFAAWLKRNGISIELEPPVGTGHCEFRAETAPTTWWEIKTPLDLPGAREEAAVHSEIQHRLRSVDQPYVIHLRASKIPPDRVPAAIKAIKRQMYAHYKAEGALPTTFEEDGIVLEVTSTTKRSKGYLGSLFSAPRLFANEQSAHVVKRVIEAADQIPRVGGGVVVIDLSSSNWIHCEDVVDACYGEERCGMLRGDLFAVRRPGAFNDPTTARVSAVIFYTRRWIENDELTMTVFHNPLASVQLPVCFLRYPEVEHRRIESEGNKHTFIITRGEQSVGEECMNQEEPGDSAT